MPEEDLSGSRYESLDPLTSASLYDEMSPRAHADYAGGTARQRELLRQTMEAEGFTVLPEEWWHFDYRDWQSYAVQNAAFENLGR